MLPCRSFVQQLTIITLILLPLLCTAAPIATQTLKTYDFENADANWKSERSDILLVSRDTQHPHLGAQCLQARLAQKAAGDKYVLCWPPIGLSKTQPGDTRVVRVKLYTRTADLPPGKAMIRFLISTTANKLRFDGPGAVVTPSTEWAPMEITIPLNQDDASIMFYARLSDDDGQGTLWIDDVTLIDEVTHHQQLITDQPFNVISADRGSMMVKWAMPEELTAGSVRVTDEMQHVCQEIHAPAGSSTTTIDLPTRGFYRVEASGAYQDGTTITDRTTTAVVGAALSDDVRAHSRFGLVNVNGDYTLAARVGAYWDWNLFLMDDAKLAQDGTVTTSKKFDFAPGLAHICAFGGILPSWLQKNTNGFYPPTDWALFEKLVTSYAQQPTFPQYFTVWNEPNIYFRGTDEEFVRFHSATARAIKAVHPETKVFGPCLSTIQMPKMKKWVGLGLLNDLDGVVVHPYVNGTPPEQEFIQKVLELRSFLDSVGKTDIPVYYTEFGWTTGNGTWQKPVDELTQARYVSRSIALLSTTKYDGLCYFTLLYHASNPGEGAFSLLNYDGTPKPGVVAFANLTRWLSTVKGEGRWLRITPTTNMTIFRRDTHTVAMLWTTEGQSTFKLPIMPTKQQDMMGRDIPIPANATVTLTPSPIYLQMPGQALCNLTMRPAVTVQPGGKVSLPWQQAMLPAPLTQSGRTVRIPPSAPLGSYLVLGKTTSGWQALPITVAKPLVIESAQVATATERTSLQLRIAVRSYNAAPATIHAVVTLSQGQRLVSPSLVVPAYGTATLAVPLATLSSNHHYQGTVTIAETDAAPVAQQPVAFTLFTGKAVTTGVPDWANMPSFDFSNDAPYMYSPIVGSQDCKPLTSSDCSAAIKTAYGENGLSLQVRVTDNQHVQAQAPEAMWKEDSIQLGFDSDADLEWQANNLGASFNGHRIFEYGIALGAQGPMVWRWLAYDTTLRANMTEPRVQVKITREENITLYTLNFPWVTLGLSAMPKSGSTIGFSLLVNDVDRDANPGVPAMTRHGLRLFNGIMDAKDPVQYGRLWLP